MRHVICKLFAARPATRRPQPRRAGLAVEALEGRLVPTAFVLSGTTLTVSGDQDQPNENDTILISTTSAGAAQVTLNGGTMTFSPGAVSTIRVNPGGGVNAVSVVGSPGEVDVTGNGSDTVTVGNGTLAGIRGPVYVTNPPSYTALTIDDSADTTARNVTVSGGAITGLAPAAIYYQQYDLKSLTVYGGSGANNFTVAGTPANALGFATTLHSGAGYNTVNVQGTDGPLNVVGGGYDDVVTVGQGGSVQGVQGAVTVTNPPSYTALTIDDSADATARSATVSGGAVTGLAPAAINYQQNDLMSLHVYGGSGGNTFTVAGVPSTPYYPGLATALHTGAGNDTVRMGAISGRLSLDGGPGTNTLDYSGYAGTVLVNLPLGAATGVSDGIGGFRNVIGGQGNNLLVGAGANDVLTGGAGRNLVIAGTQGTGTDQARLAGGAGDNLLVGGSTSYDRNLSALEALFAEWARTDLSIAQRITDLRYGGGLNGSYVLNGSTISYGSAQDALTGGTGADWLLYGGADVLLSHHATDYVS
jgi:hypothetical protein